MTPVVAAAPSPAPALPAPKPVPPEGHPGFEKTVDVFGGTAFSFGQMALADVHPDQAFDRNTRTTYVESFADLPDGRGPGVILTLVNRPGHKRPILAYAITSCLEGPSDGDPATWRVLGVLEDGTVQELDRRTGEVFPQRADRRVFTIDVSPACASFHLEITATASGGGPVHLAEVEFISPR